MSSRESSALREQAFFWGCRIHSLFPPSSPCLIPRNQLGAFCGRYQYFLWEKCRVSSRETRGRWGAGLRGERYSSGGSPWHRFYPFPRFPAFLTALQSHFQFIPGAFYRIFRFSRPVSGRVRRREWTRANTTDKTKVCIAAGPLV